MCNGNQHWSTEVCGRSALTLTPTLPPASTSSALINFFSISCTSGSLNVRPTSRLSEPIVFLKLDVSPVLADSPTRRWRGVKETRELWGTMRGETSAHAAKGWHRRDTHGVARLDTSLAMTSIPRFLATPICVGEERA